ncbi:MAG: PIG-L family deacetylase [Chloroflexi bacterium]|nr:PIG-L family deacetylase [Chloroflexota bacterium]MCC6891721.1 PIG-L family deacetylase [Anaerolineae bacterium]
MGIIPNKENDEQLSILFIGAHPDDADIQFGGTALKYLQQGHTVNYVSMTNGDAGHHMQGGGALAQRRRRESQRVAEFMGIHYIVLDNHDGELQPTVENRHKVIQIIREVKANLVITHRPNDYHADHRNTSLIVQDAAYLICVPNVVPFTPRLTFNPVIVYHQDRFRKPYPFVPEVIVDVTDTNDKKFEALSFHESQVYEWLPFIEGYLDEVPTTSEERLNWLKAKWSPMFNTSSFVADLKASADTLNGVQYIEAFERCEYGGKLTHENVKTLFPFGIVNF